MGAFNTLFGGDLFGGQKTSTGGMINYSNSAQSPKFDETPVGSVSAWFENLMSGNRDYARHLADLDYNALEAQKQRNFEERMSSTAYQRAVQDALAAGYSPAMVMSHGGASTPSGVAASAAAASHHSGQGFTNLVTSAFSVIGSLIGTGIRAQVADEASKLKNKTAIDLQNLKGNSAVLVQKLRNQPRQQFNEYYDYRTRRWSKPTTGDYLKDSLSAEDYKKWASIRYRKKPLDVDWDWFNKEMDKYLPKKRF